MSARIRDMVRTNEMETRYTEFSNILIEATEQVVPVDIRRANQRWITYEVLDMMEESRLPKHNEGLYIEKDADIQRKCQKAKEKKCYHSNVILLRNWTRRIKRTDQKKLLENTKEMQQQHALKT